MYKRLEDHPDAVTVHGKTKISYDGGTYTIIELKRKYGAPVSAQTLQNRILAGRDIAEAISAKPLHAGKQPTKNTKIKAMLKKRTPIIKTPVPAPEPVKGLFIQGNALDKIRGIIELIDGVTVAELK